jgi:hypothetical protein
MRMPSPGVLLYDRLASDGDFRVPTSPLTLFGEGGGNMNPLVGSDMFR